MENSKCRDYNQVLRFLKDQVSREKATAHQPAMKKITLDWKAEHKPCQHSANEVLAGKQIIYTTWE